MRVQYKSRSSYYLPYLFANVVIGHMIISTFNRNINNTNYWSPFDPKNRNGSLSYV